MNSLIKEHEQQCEEAVNDILSVNILNVDRIDSVSKKYIDLYNEVNYTPKGEVGRFFDLFLPLIDLSGFIRKLDVVNSALDEYNSISELTDDRLIKWLVKYEDDGLYLSTINFRTKLDNIDEIPDGFVLLHNDYDIKVEVAPFLPILNLVSIFDDHYYKTIDKYRTELDEETYYENRMEFYKKNNRQKKLIEFVSHVINPPIEDIFTINDKPFDLNKLKRYVPMRIEYYSMSSSSDKALQEAHDLFHQDEIEKARNLYKEFVQSRNDSQEAWLGLTICNFILGDYENAYITSSNLFFWRYRDLINYIEKYKEDSDVNDKEYYINDKTCEDSIRYYYEGADVKNWLEENSDLFKSISIKPKGFPSVANCHFGGKYYKNISEFHKLYEKTEFEENILKSRTHFEAVVYFIETMNSEKINQHLQGKKYCRTSKSEFIILIKELFDRFRELGDTRLYAEPGTCNGCNVGCGGFTFLSDKTRNYIEFVFEIEGDKVIDIMDCWQFKNDNITRSMLGDRMNINKDDMPF
jgi:hypothetical protein